MPSEQSTALEYTQIVAEAVRAYTFRFIDENELQEGVLAALGYFGPYREHVLDGRSRIDFIVKGKHTIGVEIKVSQSAPEVARQIRRYLRSDEIDGLVLVTTRRRHRTLEKEDFDKPVEIVWLGSSAF